MSEMEIYQQLLPFYCAVHHPEPCALTCLTSALLTFNSTQIHLTLNLGMGKKRP